MGSAQAPSSGSVPRATVIVCGVVWLALLVTATLRPSPRDVEQVEAASRICLLCGDRGTADALLNLCLFVPLGLLLGLRRRSALNAVVLGAVVSASVESAQFFLPGRHPAIGDLVWNALGTGLGATATAHLGSYFATRAQPAWVATATAAALGAAIIAAGWLLGPGQTGYRYFGLWTPDLAFMPQYRGQLLDAELDGTAVPRGAFPLDADPASELRGDWRLSGRVEIGARPEELSPVIGIFDAQQNEILVFGADRSDLVLRERTRAKAFALDQPDLRLRGAFDHVGTGDTVLLEARREDEDRCLSLGSVSRCGLGFSPGQTWGLLYFVEGFGERANRILGMAWLAVLFFCVGVMSLTPRSAAANGLLLAGAVAWSVRATRLIPGPWLEPLGAIIGLTLGSFGAWLLRRRRQGPGAMQPGSGPPPTA